MKISSIYTTERNEKNCRKRRIFYNIHLAPFYIYIGTYLCLPWKRFPICAEVSARSTRNPIAHFEYIDKLLEWKKYSTTPFNKCMISYKVFDILLFFSPSIRMGYGWLPQNIVSILLHATRRTHHTYYISTIWREDIRVKLLVQCFCLTDRGVQRKELVLGVEARQRRKVRIKFFAITR